MSTDTTTADPFIVREGSSLRTESETQLLLIQDTEQIAQWEGADSLEKASDLLRNAEEMFDCQGCREDYLPDVVDEAEELLAEMGFSVEWNDGYIIHRQQ